MNAVSPDRYIYLMVSSKVIRTHTEAFFCISHEPLIKVVDECAILESSVLWPS